MKNSLLWMKEVLVRYLTPFVFFSILGGCVKWLLDGSIRLNKMARELVLYIGSDELMTGSLWFIGMLGMAIFIMPFIIRWEKGVRYKQAAIVLFLAIASFLAEHTCKSISVPLRGRSLFAVVFYVYIGYLAKNHIKQWIDDKRVGTWLLILLPVFCFLVKKNGTVNIAVPVFHDFMVYAVCSIYGTMSVLVLSKFSYLDIVAYLGRKSLIVFSLHGIWISVYVRLYNEVMGTSFRPMVDLPITSILLGGVLILLLSAFSVWIIGPVYDRVYKNVKVLILSNKT